MLNSPKTCSDIPFSWPIDPLTPRDYSDEDHLHAYYNASVPNIKLPQIPTPPCAQNMPTPEEFFGCLDFTAASDWWAQNSTHFGFHEFDPYAPEMVEMDPNFSLAMYGETVADQNNIDLHPEFLHLDPSTVPFFDQGSWGEPGVWQPASDYSDYSSSGGQYTCAETSGSSVGFNTPSSSSGDSEAPEPLPSASAPARKSVLIPSHVFFIIIIRNTVINSLFFSRNH